MQPLDLSTVPHVLASASMWQACVSGIPLVGRIAVAEVVYMVVILKGPLIT